MISIRNSISSIRSKGREERGLTFVELLVALVIGSILITLIFKFLLSQSTSFIKMRQTSEMQQELRWAMTYMVDRIKLAGNGVPPTCGWPVVENVDGVGAEPDSISILGSFKSLVISTNQTMGNVGSQVKVDNTDGLAIGDLCVISDGTFQEIFLATDVKDMHIWHDTSPPWNDDKKLEHRYASDSSITIVTYYSFFVAEDEDGHFNLMVTTQAYEPQILLGDIDYFNIRFKMKDNSWIDEPYVDEIVDIRMIEITLRARSSEPIQGYIDPDFGDSYRRAELKSLVIPKSITIL